LAWPRVSPLAASILNLYDSIRKITGRNFMHVETQTAGISSGRLWTGRILSILVVLFLLFDAGIKFTHSTQMLQICARLGLAPNLLPIIGIILLICTAFYAIPQTAPLGALFLTGYLGGAVVIQMRVGSPAFETVFPIIFALVLWAALLLRDDRLRVLLPGQK